MKLFRKGLFYSPWRHNPLSLLQGDMNSLLEAKMIQSMVHLNEGRVHVSASIPSFCVVLIRDRMSPSPFIFVMKALKISISRKGVFACQAQISAAKAKPSSDQEASLSDSGENFTNHINRLGKIFLCRF